MSVQWYAVQALARREKIAQLNIENQNYRTFLPFFWKTVRHARQLRTVQQALFPGYLFVALDTDRDRWRSINGTPGVARLISNGDLPACVPRHIIEELLRNTDEKGSVRLNQQFVVGQKVRIVKGPMTDLVGDLLSLDDAGRVRVLLEIMSGKIVVTLNSENLHPSGN
jgi:transcription elongation factor/antiterminator RfaH